jgi:hypothetical protein
VTGTCPTDQRFTHPLLETDMRSILLLLIGIPLPIVILIALFVR